MADATKIKAALQEVQASVKNCVSDINRGGCCVLAAAVGAELVKRGLEVDIVVMRTWESSLFGQMDIDEVDKHIKDKNDPIEWQDNGIFFAHVGVRFKLDKWYVFDSDAINEGRTRLSKPAEPILKGSFSVEQALEFSKIKAAWNDTFDRKQIPLVKKLVKQAFAEV